MNGLAAQRARSRKEPDDESRRTACLGGSAALRRLRRPTPNENEAVVSIKAASLKTSDKMIADSSHYDSVGQLPAVVGLDGVGVLEDGSRVYCGGLRPPYWASSPGRA